MSRRLFAARLRKSSSTASCLDPSPIATRPRARCYSCRQAREGNIRDIPAARYRANFGQLGAVLGLVADPANHDVLYASSYIKRHTGIAATPGTIFRIPPEGGGAPTVFVNLPAGADPHSTTVEWLRDGGAWDAVGKVGVGDLTVSPKRTALLVTNLFDRRLYRIPLADPSAFTSVAIPRPASCVDPDWRPFGLGIERTTGTVFLGGTCTAQSTQLSSDLALHVFTSADDGMTFGAVPVLSSSLNFNRKCQAIILPDGNINGATNNNDAAGACTATDDPHLNARRRPWLDSTPPVALDDVAQYGSGGNLVHHSSPLVTDIAFSHDGGIAIGVRDRFADQVGSPGYAPAGIAEVPYEAVQAGDVYRACRVAGVWQLESGGSCGKGVVGTPHTTRLFAEL